MVLNRIYIENKQYQVNETFINKLSNKTKKNKKKEKKLKQLAKITE